MLVVLGIFSVVVSFYSGTDGLELFLALLFLMGIILFLSVFDLLRRLFASSMWFIIKVAGLVFGLFFLFTILGMIMMPFADELYATEDSKPVINWLVLLVILISYLLNKSLLRKKVLTLQMLAIQIISAIFSTILMITAFLLFIKSETLLQSLLLVIAAELQFIMNFIYTKTNYVETTHKKVMEHVGYRRLGQDLKLFALTVFIGFPAAASLVIVVIAAEI